MRVRVDTIEIIIFGYFKESIIMEFELLQAY
jgi:hypothetical protein